MSEQTTKSASYIVRPKGNKKVSFKETSLGLELNIDAGKLKVMDLTPQQHTFLKLSQAANVIVQTVSEYQEDVKFSKGRELIRQKQLELQKLQSKKTYLERIKDTEGDEKAEESVEESAPEESAPEVPQEEAPAEEETEAPAEETQEEAEEEAPAEEEVAEETEEEEAPAEDEGEKSVDLDVKEAVKQISTMVDVDAINAFIDGDLRKTVKTQAAERIEKLSS